MIVRTDAVVLRTLDYGETSRIVTALTRAHGVVGLLANGARRPTSRFGSTLQPMAALQLVYYYRPGRGLQRLTEAAHLVRFPRLTTELPRMTLGLRAVELARGALDEGDAPPLALDALVRTLGYLDAAETPDTALPWFQLRLMTLLGFAPDIDRERVLALGDDGGWLDVERGAVAPLDDDAANSGTTVRASRAALRAFAILARTDLETAGRLRLDAETRRDVEALVDAFLRRQTEALPERVRRVSDQIEAGLSAAARGRGAAERS